MKTVTAVLSAAVLSVLVATASAQSPAAPSASTATSPARHEIVVSYFHGDFRCATCKKIEAFSRDAIEKTFTKELATGRLVFKAVNIDRAENEHFIHDYSLVTRSLVVTEETDGKILRWMNLEKIWELVRGDQQAFTDYVAAAVRTYLGPVS
jgi:hypothetical protein